MRIGKAPSNVLFFETNFYQLPQEVGNNKGLSFYYNIFEPDNIEGTDYVIIGYDVIINFRYG